MTIKLKPRNMHSVEEGIDALEAAKTAALTRMHPDEVAEETTEVESPAFPERNEGLASLGTGIAQDFTDFQLRINSIQTSLDGGVATFEGDVEIEEYLDNEFVSRISISLSVSGEETMPIGEVENRLLEGALERLHAAGSLTLKRMQASLEQTRRDENIAYSHESIIPT